MPHLTLPGEGVGLGVTGGSSGNTGPRAPLQNYPLAFLRGDNGHAVTQLWETAANHCQRSNSKHTLSFKIIIEL